MAAPCVWWSAVISYVLIALAAGGWDLYRALNCQQTITSWLMQNPRALIWPAIGAAIFVMALLLHVFLPWPRPE